MQGDFDQGVSETLLELKDCLYGAGASSESVNLVRLIETLRQCECGSEKDRGEFLKCAVAILSLFS